MRTFNPLFALLGWTQLATVLSYTVPPGSPGFYHGNSTSAVTFDEHSLFLGDKRLYVFSGEVHTWRMPSGPAVWRDVFQKLKANSRCDLELSDKAANVHIYIYRLPGLMRSQCTTIGACLKANMDS